MRKFFQAVQEVGICKIYTNYGIGANGKLKSKGSFSFIRTDDIPEPQYKQLKQNLEDIGVRVEKYNPLDSNKLKCSIFVNDFYEGDLSASEDDIEKKMESQLRQKFKEILG